MKHLVKLVIMIIALFFIYFIFFCKQINGGLCCKPGINFISKNREEIFLRDIYILLDCTKSMSNVAFNEAKDIIKKYIFQSVGPGDRIFSYCIKANFDEIQNRIFSQQDQLGFLKALLNKDYVDYCLCFEEVCGDWQQSYRKYEEIKQSYQESLSKLNLSQDSKDKSGDKSDYINALSYVARRIKSVNIENKWLIVIGDLKQDPSISDTPSDLSDEEKNSFKDLKNVWLIYWSVDSQQKEIQPRLNFWRKYFADRGNSDVHFESFDGAMNLSNPLLSSECEQIKQKCVVNQTVIQKAEKQQQK